MIHLGYRSTLLGCAFGSRPTELPRFPTPRPTSRGLKQETAVSEKVKRWRQKEFSQGLTQSIRHVCRVPSARNIAHTTCCTVTKRQQQACSSRWRCVCVFLAAQKLQHSGADGCDGGLQSAPCLEESSSSDPSFAVKLASATPSGS